MPINIIENNAEDILELEATGKLAPSDFQGLDSTFQRFLKQQAKLRVLFRMRDFHGWQPAAFGDEVKFDLKHFHDIERLAMVGDKQWEKFLSVLSHAFTAAEVHYFDDSELAAARVWIQSNPAVV